MNPPRPDDDARKAGDTPRSAYVRHRDEIDPTDCPHGTVERIVTGGAGGVANVHVVRVSRGDPHYHAAYDEVYYVLSGTGTLRSGEHEHALRPGTVAVIPRGLTHSLTADDEKSPLEFVIFGTPPMSITDERARPRR